jgi:flavin-dependent dehydrogenase
VEEEMRVTDLTTDANGRVNGVVVLGPGRETRTLSSRYVVGADGLRSVVGRRLNLIRTSRIWPKRIALVAHYRDVADVNDYGEMHVDYDGYFGIVAVGGGMINVAVVVPMSRAKEIGEGRTEFFEEYINSRPHLAERFVGATRLTPVRATGPFASITRRPWAPGAALVGDAADFFDPFTGEGIYAALRGGELLSEILREALKRPLRDEAKVMAGYQAARRREWKGKWKLERIVGVAIAYPYFLNNAAKALSRQREMADLLVGVAGDFIPPELVLSPRFLFNLFVAPAFRA